jgi:hypothetical protein
VTELAKQFAIVLEISAENDREAEYVLSVRDRVQDVLPQMRTKLDNFLRMTTRAKPSAAATESEQVFVAAVWATDSGKSLLQVAAFQIPFDNL